MLTFVKNYAGRIKRTPPRPINILIVDDEEPVRKFVDRVLRDEDHVGGVHDVPDAERRLRDARLGLARAAVLHVVVDAGDAEPAEEPLLVHQLVGVDIAERDAGALWRERVVGEVPRLVGAAAAAVLVFEAARQRQGA